MIGTINAIIVREVKCVSLPLSIRTHLQATQFVAGVMWDTFQTPYDLVDGGIL